MPNVFCVVDAKYYRKIWKNSLIIFIKSPMFWKMWRHHLATYDTVRDNIFRVHSTMTHEYIFYGRLWLVFSMRSRLVRDWGFCVWNRWSLIDKANTGALNATDTAALNRFDADHGRRFASDFHVVVAFLSRRNRLYCPNDGPLYEARVRSVMEITGPLGMHAAPIGWPCIGPGRVTAPAQCRGTTVIVR